MPQKLFTLEILEYQVFGPKDATQLSDLPRLLSLPPVALGVPYDNRILSRPIVHDVVVCHVVYVTILASFLIEPCY